MTAPIESKANITPQRLRSHSPLCGNKYWRKRKRHGRRPKFLTPDQLLSACVDYFEWVTENPLYETRLLVYQDKSKTYQITKHRPMTKTGLYRHLKIDRRTWRNYRTRKDFFPVCEWVEDIIYMRLFELAATGLINPRFIAPYLARYDRE